MGQGCITAASQASRDSNNSVLAAPSRRTRLWRDHDRVVVTSLQNPPELGTVRYQGPEQGGIVGLEMDTAGGVGRHDGLDPLYGKRHFKCKAGKGVYLAETSSFVQPIKSNTEEASTAAVALSTALESLEEQETLRQLAFGKLAKSALKAESEGAPWASAYRKVWDAKLNQYLYIRRCDPMAKPVRRVPPGCQVLHAEGGPEWEDKVPSGADMRSVPSAIGRKWGVQEARNVYEFCCHKWNEAVPVDLMLKLVRMAKDLFLQESTVQMLRVPKNGKVVVFGDTHGHLKDVVHVFTREGAPDKDCIYVFNGDICDRGDTERRGGATAMHIWACVLAFKVAMPECIYVNRGNHEDYNYSAHAGKKGFHKGEIARKYAPNQAEDLDVAFNDLYQSLPLAAVIDEKVLVLHAGVPRDSADQHPTTLDELARLPRPIDLNSIKELRNRFDRAVMDVVWADPQNKLGIGASTRGSKVANFGPDLVSAFLRKSDLQMFIRSHQLPTGDYAGRGFQWWHQHAVYDGLAPPEKLSPSQKAMCLTVFSASEYCGASKNMGATVVFTGSANNFELKEHSAIDAEKSLKTQEPDRTARLEQDALHHAAVNMELVVIILKFRPQLLAEFRAADKGSEWFLDLDVFLSCCHKAVPEIPWDNIHKHHPNLIKIEDGRVCYTRFITRYKLCFRSKDGQHSRIYEQMMRQLFDQLVAADRPLKELFGVLDPDSDGTVSAEEFASVLAQMKCMVTEEQVQMMSRMMTSKGKIAVEDFLGKLSVNFALKKAKSFEGSLTSEKLDALCRDICATEMQSSGKASVAISLRQFFERNDANGSGFLDEEELLTALSQLPSAKDLDDADKRRIIRHMDGDGNGRINYLELLSTFSVQHVQEPERESGQQLDRPSPHDVVDDLVETVCCVLVCEYGLGTIRELLHHVVPHGSTRCTPEQFRQVLVKLTSVPNDVHLSHQQVDCLIESLDVSDNGDLDFVEFVQSFEIMDTERVMS